MIAPISPVKIVMIEPAIFAHDFTASPDASGWNRTRTPTHESRLTHLSKGSTQPIDGAAMWTAVGVILGAYAGLPLIAEVPLVAGATLVGGRLAAKAAEESCSHRSELQ
jgi:hypothetical protein